MATRTPLWRRWRDGLGRTRRGLGERLRSLVGGGPPGGAAGDYWETLEAILIQADVGVETTRALLDGIRRRARQAGGGREAEPAALLREEMLRLLGEPVPLRLDARPAVVLLVGVNGSGKTTTAGRLARLLRGEGRRVLLGAADTFRAAAGEQLAAWAAAADAALVRGAPGADPAAVAFDAVQAGVARGADVVLLDTAGRLHTREGLMAELGKVARAVGRALPGAPHETLLVLDATTGQNGLAQAEAFRAAVPLTGVVLTKLDGTAKGGIVLAVAGRLGVPVKLAGVGEGPDDLVPFDPAAFVDNVLG